jgi:LPXTG-motif cell wall-anchored protein
LFLASFLDHDNVPLAIVGGYLALMFVLWAFRRRRRDGPARAMGCITGVGLFVLLGAMALTDWLVDSVF